MSRGIADDPAPNPNDNESTTEIEQVIHDLILSHNKLHDRLVHLEREVDQLTLALSESLPKHRKR